MAEPTLEELLARQKAREAAAATDANIAAQVQAAQRQFAAQQAAEAAAREEAALEAESQRRGYMKFQLGMSPEQIDAADESARYRASVAEKMQAYTPPRAPSDVQAEASANAASSAPAFQGPPAPGQVNTAFGPMTNTPGLPTGLALANYASSMMPKQAPKAATGGGGGGGQAPSPWMLAVNPYANAAHQDALRMSKAAIQGRQALGERAASEDAGVFKGEEQMLEEAGQRYADLKAAQAAQARAAEEKYTNALEAMGSGEIDNDRWWNNKTTGQKIATGIGALMAGLGSGMTRDAGSNAGVDMLNQQMAMDIAAQKDKYARAGKKAEGYQTLYGQMMRRFGDEEQAFNAAMALGMNKAQAKLRTLAASRGGEEAGLRAQELMAKLAEQEQQWLMAVYKPRPTGGGLSWKEQIAREAYKKRVLGGVDLEQAEAKAQIESKYSKKGSEDLQKGEQSFASALQGAKIPESLATIAGTEQALERAGGDLGGRMGRTVYNASPLAYQKYYGPEKYAAMQAVEQLMMAGRADVFGSAYSKEQGATFDRAFQAGDTEGLKNSIAGLRAKQEAKAQTLGAGYTENVRDAVLYKSGLSLPQSKPPSFKANQ